MSKDAMIFRRSYMDAVNKIHDRAARLNLLMAIVKYGLTGESEISEDVLFRAVPELKKDFEERSDFRNEKTG